MSKVWYGELVKDTLCVRFQRIPLFFLKHIEQAKAALDESLVFGGFVNVSQLRTWARPWLWLKKVSEIKVW